MANNFKGYFLPHPVVSNAAVFTHDSRMLRAS